jgi:hypothetical protein
MSDMVYQIGAVSMIDLTTYIFLDKLLYILLILKLHKIKLEKYVLRF